MITQKFIHEVPFKEVYVHGLVRDSEGQKMSKSKGNIIDPIDIIDGIELKELIEKRTLGLMNPNQKEKIIINTKKEFPNGINSFGTDAMRFTFCSLASGSRDINFDLKRLEGYRNFCNKLWNAANFIKIQCKGYDNENILSRNLEDVWIYDEFNKTAENFSKHIDSFRFYLATQVTYDFFWEKFCDWYIEFCKIKLNDTKVTQSEKNKIKASLIDMMNKSLILFHPILPFITEEIWQDFKPFHKSNLLSISQEKFPKFRKISKDFSKIEALKKSISGVRNIRSEMLISHKTKIDILCESNGSLYKLLKKNKSYLQNMAGIDKINKLNKKIPPSAILLIENEKIYIPLKGLIDVQDEKARSKNNLVKLEKTFQGLKKQLENKKFIKNAPKSLVAERKSQLKESKVKMKKLNDHLKVLELI